MKERLELKPEERLILPADFRPDRDGVEGIRRRVLGLAEAISGTGVTIKVNSALRACGYELIRQLHAYGVQVMVDLKLNDISETMEIDAAIIAAYDPRFLTVMCSAGIDGMRRANNAMGITHILGVTVLTSLDEEESQAIYGCSTKAGVLRFARMAKLAGLQGLVLSPQELAVIGKKSELSDLSLNTPGIRPLWSLVEGDDQSRVMTPAQAIAAGADRLVIGRPLFQVKPNKEGKPQNLREAIARTIEEIAEALAESQ